MASRDSFPSLLRWTLLLALGAAGSVGACTSSSTPSVTPTSSSGAGVGAGGNTGPAGFGGAGSLTDSASPVPGTHRSEEPGENGKEAHGAAIEEGCVTLWKETPPPTHVYYESADDSNSMGSPVLARQVLNAHGRPDTASIRAYEFLNYYHVGYAPPASGATLSVSAAALRDGSNHDGPNLTLQVGIRALTAPSVRRPMTLTFVLDTSGSMAGEGIARERAILRAVSKKLVKNDLVSVLTWNVDDAVVLRRHKVTGPADSKLASAAEALRSKGGSDLHAGLVAAYAVAREGFDKERVNRVVLVSDGGANLGVTDASIITAATTAADTEGLYLTGVGTGPAQGYSDALMNQLTDAGRGAYVYLDTDAEAEHMFGERFDEVMSIAAREVQLRVAVPWYLDISDFHGEAFSPNPAEIEPQHLAPGGEMVFNQVLTSCDAKQIDVNDLLRLTVSWSTPFGSEPKSLEIAPTIGSLLETGARELAKGNAIVRYAGALQRIDGAHDALRAVHAELTELLARKDLAGDAELTEIDGLVQAHPDF